MNALYMQAIAVLIGLIAGLWLRRVVRGLVAVIVLAAIIAIALIATGRGAVLEANGYLVPQAVSLSGQMILALKQLLLGAPGTLVGLLLGVAVRETVALVKT